MYRRFGSLMAVLAASGVIAATPALAQKNRPAPSGAPRPAAPPSATPDSSAGVPKPRRASPTLVRPGAAPAPAPAAAPAPASPDAITRQASTGVAAATGGLSIAPFDGDDAARLPYLRQFTQQLDSAIVSLVSVFRNTSGQPLPGAEAPTSLSARERDRWSRCRDLHWDLQSYATAMHDLVEQDNATVARAAVALDSSLTALQATSECDNVASMIAAPERWTPWQGNYTTSARNFYGSWYGQIRDVAEKNRAFVIALNATLPAAQRMPVPPAMPRTPPYAGGGPR